MQLNNKKTSSGEETKGSIQRAGVQKLNIKNYLIRILYPLCCSNIPISLRYVRFPINSSPLPRQQRLLYFLSIIRIFIFNQFSGIGTGSDF